jgi:antitoxin MazE
MDIHEMGVARVARWGNSLAIRIPARVVEALKLKEGDNVDLERGEGEHTLLLSRRMTSTEAIEGIRAMQRPLPEGWKFDRDEIYGEDPS